MKTPRELHADEIECRVKKVTKSGLVILLYKTARTDMNILDETYGAENWQTDYKEIKGNLYCGIGIRSDTGEWIWKWNCGIESREDGEGNEKKGEASDAFKRAGTLTGIGRSLYTAPFIFVKKGKYKEDDKGKPKEDFAVEKYAAENGKITQLVIKNQSGEVVYSFETAMERRLGGKLICERCGNEITAHGRYTADQVAENSRKIYGSQLCGKCVTEAKKQ